MKTLIDIDDKLMAKAMKAGFETKKAAVHAGLALVAAGKAKAPAKAKAKPKAKKAPAKKAAKKRK